jgi:drug/metabolite transporter (DMT)-like permease
VEDQIRRLHLERFSREDWVLAILGVVLILDLLVLPWFSFGATINVGSATVSIGGSLTAVDAPDAWLGVLALLSCAFLVADLGFQRLSPETRVPSIASDRETTRYVLACVAAVLIALKFLFHIGRFGELALGFWLAVLLVGALVALTRRTREARRVVPPPAGEPAPEPGPTL